MDDTAPSFTGSTQPTIEPSFFDLIVSGTGLPESLLSAAAAAVGKCVLHLDPNSFYGSHFSSLSPDFLTSFLHQKNHSLSSSEYSPPPSSVTAVVPEPCRLYSDVEISGEVPEPPGSFLLDVSGPRVLYCADPAVDVMLRSGASHHVEFKSVDASLFYWEGRLCTVPDSREAIFKDKSLGLTEKRQMMSFLKLVRGHIGSAGEEGEGTDKIPEEDLEIPFAEFMEKKRLPPKIKLIVLYAIAMADDDQESTKDCQKLMKVKEGIERLALYNSSIGRFSNAVGAFIYPIYGQGELPQAFCRCAAVKGALYVLRMPVAALLIDKETRHYKGVRLASGQDIYSNRLVMDASFTVPPSVLSPSSQSQQGAFEERNPEGVASASSMIKRVARGICITRGSVQPDLANVLVVFPPRSLNSRQVMSVRALQLGSCLAVCPRGLFVMYLSTPCDNTTQGKECLHAAINALFTRKSEDCAVTDNEDREDTKPILLWSALYIQEVKQAIFDTVTSCPMPDGNLDYRSMLESTMQLFDKMYPEDEFLPETPPIENFEEDGALLE